VFQNKIVSFARRKNTLAYYITPVFYVDYNVNAMILGLAPGVNPTDFEFIATTPAL
jgi:hypothetical protein